MLEKILNNRITVLYLLPFCLISIVSLSLGFINGFTSVIVKSVSNAMKILNEVKIVSVTGITPILDSNVCPGVDTNNALEEE